MAVIWARMGKRENITFRTLTDFFFNFLFSYCHVQNVTLVAPIKGFVNVTSGNENALKVALFKNGPISVAIDASRRTFSFYSHGVYYDDQCKNNLDGLDHGEDFLLIF